MQEVSSFSDNLSLVPATAAVRGKSRSSLSSHQALRALVGELFDLLSINHSSMYDRDGGVNAAITPRSISASPRSPPHSRLNSRKRCHGSIIFTLLSPLLPTFRINSMCVLSRTQLSKHASQAAACVIR